MLRFFFVYNGSCTRNHFYTYPHPHLKTDEKCHQKAELGFAECNFQNSDKKYLAYGVVCALNDCFCRQKAKMNFTQSMGFAEGLYAFTITLHTAQLCLPLS